MLSERNHSGRWVVNTRHCQGETGVRKPFSPSPQLYACPRPGNDEASLLNKTVGRELVRRSHEGLYGAKHDRRQRYHDKQLA